jgi:hypothetical protein
MKKQYLKIVLPVVAFIGFSAVAQAEVRDEIVVTLPFDFVVSGENLPAGTYTVSRLSDDKLDGLILSSQRNHVSVVVHPTAVGDAVADKPSVSFNHVGNSHFLSQIETAYDKYTIVVSPVEHAGTPELK